MIEFPVYMLNRRRLLGYLSLNIATRLYELELAFNTDKNQDEGYFKSIRSILSFLSSFHSR